MEWTIGRVMALLAFLFGLAVGGYFIFRPKVINKNVVINGSDMDDNRS